MIYKSAAPLACPRVARRVVILVSCPLPVSLPHWPQNPPVWGESWLGHGRANGLRRLLFELRIAIFIQSSFQSPLEPVWKRFGTNFGTILGAKVGHQSIIDSVRSRIYAKSIFERLHQWFEWFLLSQGFQNSINFYIKSFLKRFLF